MAEPQAELLRFLGDIGLAADCDARRRAGDTQVVALHHAVLDAYVTVELVESKAFAEQILEIE
jgi:hypothetical protein